jgi:hypothetical protein
VASISAGAQTLPDGVSEPLVSVVGVAGVPGLGDLDRWPGGRWRDGGGTATAPEIQPVSTMAVEANATGSVAATTASAG